MFHPPLSFFYLTIPRPPTFPLFPNSTLFRFFFNDTATTEIYPLSLHGALPICFRDVGGECERITRGDLAVTNLPFLLRPLGAIAERIIHGEAHKLLDQEAKVLQQFLDSQAK